MNDRVRQVAVLTGQQSTVPSRAVHQAAGGQGDPCRDSPDGDDRHRPLWSHVTSSPNWEFMTADGLTQP